MNTWLFSSAAVAAMVLTVLISSVASGQLQEEPTVRDEQAKTWLGMARAEMDRIPLEDRVGRYRGDMSSLLQDSLILFVAMDESEESEACYTELATQYGVRFANEILMRAHAQAGHRTQALELRARLGDAAELSAREITELEESLYLGLAMSHVREQDSQAALASVNSIESTWRRVDAILALAKLQESMADHAGAQASLEAAEEIVRVHGGPYGENRTSHSRSGGGGWSTSAWQLEQWWACYRLANSFARIGNTESAILLVSFAQSIGPQNADEDHFAVLILEGCVRLASVGELERARELLSKLPSTVDPSRALAGIAVAEAKAGALEQALETSHSIQWSFAQAKALSGIIPFSGEELSQMLPRVVSALGAIPKEDLRSYAQQAEFQSIVNSVATALAERGEVEAALRFLQTTPNLEGNVDVQTLAAILIQSGQVAEGFRAVEDSDSNRRTLMQNAAYQAALVGQANEVEKWMESLGDACDRAFVALGVAKALLEQSGIITPGI